MSEKLKLGKEFDVDELDVEWTETDFEDYEGEQPPTGTVLAGGVKKMWWTETANGDAMIKVLWVAAGNGGELAEYNGLPVWDNIVFTPKAAFRYGPFLQTLGLTLKQVKTTTVVADDDDSIGAPIEKIAKVVPGTESTECGIVTKRRKYNGEWQVNVAKYIEQPDVDDDDDDEEEEAPRRSRRKPAADKPAPKKRSRPEPEEDDDEDTDDDEPDEEVDDDDEDEEDDEEEEETPAPKRRAAAKKPAAKTPAKKPAAKPSRRKAADDDEEPF